MKCLSDCSLFSPRVMLIACPIASQLPAAVPSRSRVLSTAIGKRVYAVRSQHKQADEYRSKYSSQKQPGSSAMPFAAAFSVFLLPVPPGCRRTNTMPSCHARSVQIGGNPFQQNDPAFSRYRFVPEVPRPATVAGQTMAYSRTARSRHEAQVFAA